MKVLVYSDLHLESMRFEVPVEALEAAHAFDVFGGFTPVGVTHLVIDPHGGTGKGLAGGGVGDATADGVGAPESERVAGGAGERPVVAPGGEAVLPAGRVGAGIESLEVALRDGHLAEAAGIGG